MFCPLRSRESEIRFLGSGSWKASTKIICRAQFDSKSYFGDLVGYALLREVLNILEFYERLLERPFFTLILL